MKAVARIAAETGISPDVVLGLDGDVFRALGRAADRRWTAVEELLAFQVELTYELVRRDIAKGGGRPPRPLRITRPVAEGRDGEAKKPRKSTAGEVLAFAGAFGAVKRSG